MSDSYLICSCGNQENSHQFKHVYTPKIKVNIGNIYQLNANQFPKMEEDRCSYPQCKFSKELHSSVYSEEEKVLLEKQNIQVHDFKPSSVEYRIINFTVPFDATCLHCFLSLEEHDKSNHIFIAPVVILNKEKNDIVKLSHPTDYFFKISEADIKYKV